MPQVEHLLDDPALTDYKIVEHANGSCQVWWKDSDGFGGDWYVLEPGRLHWERGYQSEHDFMFFSSFERAKQGLYAMLDKEAGRKVVAEHRVFPQDILDGECRVLPDAETCLPLIAGELVEDATYTPVRERPLWQQFLRPFLHRIGLDFRSTTRDTTGH